MAFDCMPSRTPDPQVCGRIGAKPNNTSLKHPKESTDNHTDNFAQPKPLTDSNFRSTHRLLFPPGSGSLLSK
jgi:hypothetical protein